MSVFPAHVSTEESAATMWLRSHAPARPATLVRGCMCVFLFFCLCVYVCLYVCLHVCLYVCFYVWFSVTFCGFV